MILVVVKMKTGHKMFLDKMQQLADVIDQNKGNISDKDYLQICKLMKDVYNNHNNVQDIDEDSMEISYRQSEAIKQFISVMVIISNISTIILLFVYMNKVSFTMKNA